MSHLLEGDVALGKEVSFDREQVPGKAQLWEISSQHSWQPKCLGPESNGELHPLLQEGVELCGRNPDF